MIQKKTNIAIVAGGALSASFLTQIHKADYIIGVDRGAFWLIQNRVIPDVAIGDFDSVTPQEFRIIENKAKAVIRYSAEKDATDLELAIEHVKTLKPKEVALFGVIGTRFDHTWAGIHLLLRLSSYNIYGYIVDNFNEIYIVRREITLKASKLLPYVSIFPIGKQATVTLTGFRYNVVRHIFNRGSTLGVSNEIQRSTARILIHKGSVLLVRSRD